ncbi:hypothetical protein N7G274_000247 [Stereocaulon virgatum]|uniref:Uncharacterized protein n=1 Tax=Stereocaulon virgatum TaxID=373712 RepID=A0ABR4AU51_9LECA
MQATIAFLFAFQFYVQLASSVGYKCYARVYGRPSLSDCTVALNDMPDADSRAPTPRLSDPRFFIEPQYLVPPFKRVLPQDNTEIEQLPKFWRHRSCRIALMSVANDRGIVPDPTPSSKWAYIEFNALDVVQKCIGRRLPQGGFGLISGRVGAADSSTGSAWRGG